MIDIGANLTSDKFKQIIAQTISNAKEAGVEKIIVTGTDIESSNTALTLCHQHSALYATAGIHPHHACDFDETSIAALSALLLHSKVVAVGETGLDFNRNFSTPDQQIRAFTQHIELAINCQKPLFLHEREAFDTQYQILKDARAEIKGAVVHCFTGTQVELEQYLSLDLYIGITGWICDERRGLALQKMVDIIPDNRLLIETDSPYLTPRTLTGKAKRSANTPANLPHIANFIATLRGQSLAQISTMSQQNSCALFNL